MVVKMPYGNDLLELELGEEEIAATLEAKPLPEDD